MVGRALGRPRSSRFPCASASHSSRTGALISHEKRGWVPDQLRESLTKLVFHISHVSTADCFLASGMPERSRCGHPILLAGESPKRRETDVVFLSQTSPLPPSMTWAIAPCHTGYQGTQWPQQILWEDRAVCCPWAIQAMLQPWRVWRERCWNPFASFVCNNLAAHHFSAGEE